MDRPMNSVLRFARGHHHRDGLFLVLHRRRPNRLNWRCSFLTATVLALTFCFVATAPAQADGQLKSLHMVTVGITNAAGHPVLKATAKDALDIAKWGYS